MTTTHFNAVPCATAISAHHVSPQPVAIAPKKKSHVRIEHDFIEGWLPVIGHKAFAVYAVLLKRRGTNETAFPSHKRLSKDTGMSISSVKRALETLREHGLCAWVNRSEPTEYGNNRQTSNAYFIANSDLPAQSIVSDAPRSQRATKQVKEPKLIKEQQTAPRASSTEATVVVDFQSSISVPAPQSLSSEAQRTRLELERKGFESKVALWLIETHGEKECAYQLERLSREKGVRNAVKWLRTAIKEGHRESRPMAQETAIPTKPAPSTNEVARKRMEDLALAREGHEAAERAFAKLDGSKQAFILRCVELEKAPLEKVLRRTHDAEWMREMRKERLQ